MKADLKKYGTAALVVLGTLFVATRVFPGIGMRVGLRPDPLPFMPAIPILNPVMRSSAPAGAASDPSARDSFLAVT